MATSVIFNGVTYSVPATGEDAWGANVSNYLIAIASGALQKTGGTFTLTAELNFGAGFGIKSLYYGSRTANGATAGILRLAVADLIAWRNNANGANLTLGVNGSDQLVFNGVTLSGSVTTMGAFGSSPNANAGTISSNTLVLQPADGTNPGGVSTTTQTFAGAKTFTSALTVAGGASGGDLFIPATSTGQGRINFGVSATPTKGQILYSDNDDSMRFFTNTTEALRILSTGVVRVVGRAVLGLGAGSDSSVALVQLGSSAAQTLLSGTTQAGSQSVVVSNSSATSRTLGGSFEYRTEATAYTTGVGAGVRILTPTVGAGSTVTRNVGLLFQGIGTSGTNNAIVSDNEVFSGNFALNFSSTNASVFAGSITASNLSGTNTGDQTITLTGEATGTGTGSFAVTLTNSAVIGKVLTGYTSGAGVVAATDTILQAIQKLNGNAAASTAATSVGAFGSSPNSAGATLSSNILNLEPASATQPGGISTTTQTLAGVKTFVNNVFITTPSTLQIGTTTGVFNTSEQLSNLYTVTSPAALTAAAFGSEMVLTGNSVNTVNVRGARFRLTRTTTGVVSESGGLFGFSTSLNINNGANAYTNTLTSFFSSAISVGTLVTGASAPTMNYAGIGLNVDATTVTGYKVGFFTGGVSGGTNNALFADNIAFTGSFALNISSTNPSVFSGRVQVAALSQTRTANSTTSTPQNALTSSGLSFITLTGSVTMTINGIVAGVDGQRLILGNSTGNTLSLTDQNGSAASADQLLCPNSATVSVRSNGAVELIYDSSVTKWRVIAI